jgi:phage FluMu protein Com
MPIRFRCSFCNRLLGIATRKAGTQTRCPHCGYEITVPVPADESKTEHLSREDGSGGFARGVTDVLIEPAVASAPPAGRPVNTPAPAAPAQTVPPVVAPPVQHPAPKSHSKPTTPEERPLFEGDLDEIFGTTVAPPASAPANPPAPVGVDAASLGTSALQIVLSPQKATFLMVAVVVLMALSFAAGYFLAPKG